MRSNNRFWSIAFFHAALAAVSACSAGGDPGDKKGDDDDGKGGGDSDISLDGSTRRL